MYQEEGRNTDIPKTSRLSLIAVLRSSIDGFSLCLSTRQEDSVVEYCTSPILSYWLFAIVLVMSSTALSISFVDRFFSKDLRNKALHKVCTLVPRRR
jgi:hypothetical protein